MVRLDQLSDVSGGQTLVASLLLDESSAGTTVFDLVGLIEARVASPEVRRRLQSIIASSLGNGWRDATEVRFNTEVARQKLRLYWGRDIPSVALPLPAEVKEVSFKVDLSTTRSLSLEVAGAASEFFRDVLPAP